MLDNLSYLSRQRWPNGDHLLLRGPGAAERLLQLAIDETTAGTATVVVTNTVRTKDVRRAIPPAGSGPETGNAPTPFGSYGFAHTVGLWLPFGRSPAGRWLSPFLSTEGYTFTPHEYLDLRERLTKAIRMHHRRPRASGVLEELNTGFFRHRSLEQSTDFLTGHLNAFYRQAQELFRAYTEAVNAYGRRAIFLQQDRLGKRKVAIDELVAASAVRPGRRQCHRRTAALLEAWSAYCREWLSEVATRRVPTPEELAAEQTTVGELTDSLYRDLAAETLSLSPLTADPRLGEADHFRALADRLESLHQAIDEAGIYQLPLGGSTAVTTSRQLQVVDALRERLARTRAHLPDLADFYTHRQFWYAQPARLRRLLGPLEKLPAKHWPDAFASWYFDRSLEEAGLPARHQLRCAELADLVRTPPPADRAGSAPLPVFIRPGQPVPPATELLIDLTGNERPTDYSGRFAGYGTPGDRDALHCARAGRLDPRLTLLQDFHPAVPADWRLLPVDAPPPGSGGEPTVQLTDDGGWTALADWEVTATAHLRLFLPRTLSRTPSPQAGAGLLRKFDRLLLAADRITFYHDWSANDITQALLSDGFNASFLAAALLRAAEACTEQPFDRDALVAIGREIQTRCGVPPPAPHPLAEGMYGLLQPLLPGHFFTVHQPWRDTFLPLVVLSPAGEKTILLPGGKLPGYADPLTEAYRQEDIRVAGMNCLEIDAYACWEDPEREAGRIARTIGK